MKNLKLIIVTVVLAITTNLFAQTEKQTPTKVPDMLQKADYVFEGTVVDSKGFWVTLDLSGGVKKRTIFTSLLVQVNNVYKGVGMKEGLVQILVEGGFAQSESNIKEMVEVPFYLEDAVHTPKFNAIGQKGIIAGKMTSIDKGIKWNKTIENNIVIEQQRAILYCETCWDGKYDAPWQPFDNAYDLRKSIKSFNLKTDFIDRTDIVEDSIANIQYQKELVERKESEARSMQSQKEYARYMDALTKNDVILKKKLNRNQRNAQVGGSLNIDTRNFTYSTIGSQNYIEFDVYVWGTQNTFFHQTLLRFNYSKQVFGDSLYFRGGVNATRGSSFNNINYILLQGDVQNDNFQLVDSVIYFLISSNDSLVRPNRITLTTTPIQLVHLKFKIKNCAPTAKMQFIDIPRMDIFTAHAPHANDSFFGTAYLSYDNILRTDYSPIPLCPTTKITGFSPSVIRAGTGEILTITGSGFGATRGNGQVLFPDADNVGTYLKGCDTIDYVSWTNTEIKVKVPSIIVNSNYTIRGTAGSGKFKVVNNLGFRDSINTNLDVQYALLNSKNAGDPNKRRVNLIYGTCINSARTFKLHSSLGANLPAAIMIDSAINIWARFLNIDIRMEKDNYNGYIFPSHTVSQDSISSIYVNNNIDALMQTTANRFLCSNKVYNLAADIEINMNYSWHYGWDNAIPNSKFDFFHAILHELGHALGLDHAINPIANGTSLASSGYGELMYAHLLDTIKSTSQRSTLETGRQMAKVASLNIKDSSKVVNWSGCSDIKKIREFKSPSDKVGCIGAPVSFTAYCEQPSGSPAPTYQWQHLNTLDAWVNSTSFNLAATVTGATASTFTISNPGTLLNGKPFRCKISNVDGCTLYTQVAILSFNTPSFYANPTNGTVNEHGNYNFPAQSTDSTLQYKWQQKLAGSSVYNDINNGGYFSGTTTQVLSIGNTPYSFDQSYFRCKGTNTAGCLGYSTAAKLTVNPTGFAPTNPTTKIIASNLKASVFPNPSSNLITISLDDSKLIQRIVVFNSKGNVVISNSYNTNTTTLDISNFPTGLYMIKITDGNSETTKEIVITH